MDFKELTEEQRERIRSCETAEELQALAREEGLELSDDELSALAGGADVDAVFWRR
ncbi:MAG: Nif11 family protein [Eggerthellaceae bacterium]|nr:Nif11 family protein [Eggerthellaceae bacterium]